MTAEWRRVRLGDLVKIEHGWSFKSEFFSKDLSGQEIVVGVGNFDYKGGFRFDSTELKEYRASYPEQYRLRPDDILLVMTCQTAGGEILGIPGRIPNDGRTYLHNQRLGKIVIKDDTIVNRDFLYYLCLSKEFNAELVASATGTKILHTAPSRIEAFQFMLPPIKVQQQIGLLLRSLDEKMDNNRAINRTLEKFGAACFKAWFIDFDPVRAKLEARWECGQSLPGLPADLFDSFPNKLTSSELGEIPSGWTTRSLYDSAKFINGAAYRDFDFTQDDDALPIVKIAELKNGVTAQTRFTKTELDSKYRINNGEVLLSWSGNPDTSIDTFIWTGGAAWLNQHIFRVLAHRDVERYFIFYLLKFLRPTFAEIARNKQTTGLGHFTAQDMKRMPVVHPPDLTLQAFNSIIDPIYKHLYLNLINLRTISRLRGKALSNLLSGDFCFRADDEQIMRGSVV